MSYFVWWYDTFSLAAQCMDKSNVEYYFGVFCVVDILGVWYVTRGRPGHVDSAVLQLALVAGCISCTVDVLPGHYRGEFVLCEKS